MLNCIATKPDARQILFQLRKGGEVGMTVSEAILALNANVVFACGRAGFSSATVKMIEDALDTIEDALKTQEPRVMTLEEVKMLDSDYYYLESMRSPGKELREICGAYGLTCVTWPSITWARQTMGDSGYGKTWRCWTSRPTDEQRGATPWE